MLVGFAFTLHADEFLLILFPVCALPLGNLTTKEASKRNLPKTSPRCVSVKLCRHLPAPGTHTRTHCLWDWEKGQRSTFDRVLEN